MARERCPAGAGSGHGTGRRCRPGPEAAHLRQPSFLQAGIDLRRRHCLAILLTGRRRQARRQPAGRTLALAAHRHPEAAPVFPAREELAATDQVHERHRPGLRGMDHVAMIDRVHRLRRRALPLPGQGRLPGAAEM